MNRNEVVAKLKKHEAELRALGVDHLYLFGSIARGEARGIRTSTFSSITKKGVSVSTS